MKIIPKLQMSLLVLFIWIQTGNYQSEAYSFNFTGQLVFRFLLLIFILSILFFNIFIFDSLKLKKNQIETPIWVRAFYAVIVACSIICLTKFKQKISPEIIALTFIVAIDWFDEFKSFKNGLQKKLDDYRANRGLLVVENEYMSSGLFFILIINGVIIFIACKKIFSWNM